MPVDHLANVHLVGSSMVKRFHPVRGMCVQSYPGMTAAEADLSMQYVLCETDYLEPAVPPTARPSLLQRSWERQSTMARTLDATYVDVVVYFGGNDISNGQKAEDVLLHLQSIVQMLQRRKARDGCTSLPTARVCTLIPRPRDCRQKEDERRRLNELIKDFFGPRRQCIELVPALLHQRRSEGVKLDRYSRDMVHLTDLGMKDLQNYLVRTLLNWE